MESRATVTNAYLRMYPKSYSGEVTFEVRCFDEYLSRLEKIRPSKYLMTSNTFSLDWAEAGLFEVMTEAVDQVSVRIKLNKLRRSYGDWLWQLRCTCSIVGDDQKLFNVAWNDQGQTNPNAAIERDVGFSVAEYLTAARAYGKESTLRIVLQYQALGQGLDAVEYQKKPKNPVGISGNPELVEALHRGAESDFIISCQGQEYPVHRIVLKWASPVFRRMIETPMAEASSSKLVISDVDSKVVQMMIDFMYQARIDAKLENEVVNLLYCAEKYELVALKEYCLKYMKTIVWDTNVTEFLSCAVKCNAEEVVKELVDWCKQRFWRLSQKDEFRALVQANLEVFYGEE